jgi:hypothetical protein
LETISDDLDATLVISKTSLLGIDSALNIVSQNTEHRETSATTVQMKPHVLLQHKKRSGIPPLQQPDNTFNGNGLEKATDTLLLSNGYVDSPPLKPHMAVRKPPNAWEMANEDLALQPTKILSEKIGKQTDQCIHLEQVMLWQMPPSPLLLEGEGNNIANLQTNPLYALKSQIAIMRIRAYFVSIVILFVSILFLSALITCFILMHNFAYKAEILIVILIAFSYVSSVQVTRKRSASVKSKDEDLKHLNVIKQDTTAYLHALAGKDFKKGSYK